MTVIACRDGVMAADSQLTWSLTKLHGDKKLCIVRGHILGMTGDAGATMKFLKWFGLPNPKKEPDFKDENFECITLDKNGKLLGWDKQVTPYEINAEFFAFGAGMDFALGAMEMGASAVDAVKVACKWSTVCGGEVISYSVADLKKRKRNG